LDAYKAAADLAPDVAANPANCAAAALMLRQFKAAAEFAARAAVLQPSFLRAHVRAGKACLCMGQFDQVGQPRPPWFRCHCQCHGFKALSPAFRIAWGNLMKLALWVAALQPSSLRAHVRADKACLCMG
jgi:hypothetical protein